MLIGYYLRRDVNAINDLPDYMEICFLTSITLSMRYIAYENLKEKGANILPFLTKAADIQRGETANSVCYMNRTGLSEELALEHVRNLIDENRKKLNKERLDDSL
ncbi:hypothetical protein Peur_028971 [Populus x canadensis]